MAKVAVNSANDVMRNLATRTNTQTTVGMISTSEFVAQASKSTPRLTAQPA